ncbi:MAG: 50S ribosomal protein L5 [Proteobacteria bacterium]|nr:50S ribosomal protein L5 [Pseudomonadota bacterium]
MAYKSRLRSMYEKEGKEALQKRFAYKSAMQIPRLSKIIVSIGMKDAITDSKVIEQVRNELYLITGQKPVVTKAKKSIASFKLREGMPIGCMVTLRRDMMYDFVDRLINIALPRSKDFWGLNPKQFDGRGNFAMGLKEQLIFPEINYDRVDKIRGMSIAIVTTAQTDEEGRELLKIFNFPFTITQGSI